MDIFDDNTNATNTFKLKTIDHSGNNVVIKLLKFNTGEFIILGNNYSSPFNGFACKVDDNFNFIWWKDVDIWIEDATIAGNNDIIIAGKTLQDSNGHNKPAVKKMDANGSIGMEKLILENSLTWGNITSVIYTSDNSFLLGGCKNTTGQTLYSIAFVIKTDTDFNMLTSGSNKWPVYIDNQNFQGEWDEVTAMTEINNRNNNEYVVSGVSTDGIPSYGNKVWFARMSDNGAIRTRQNYNMDNDKVGQINKMIEMNKQIVSLGLVSTDDTINTTSKCWILKIEKNNLNLVSDIKKGEDGNIFLGLDICKLDDTKYAITGTQWKDFPTGWFMKWENKQGIDDLILEKHIGSADSSLVSLRGILPLENNLIIAGNKSTIKNGIFGKDSIFIMKTNSDGDCIECFK